MNLFERAQKAIDGFRIMEDQGKVFSPVFETKGVDTAEMIEQIHHEFLTASDKILEEANSILAQKLVNKASRMITLGFRNAKDVKESHQLIRKRQVADLIESFMISHPTYKIITKEKVMEICSRYKLIFGEAYRYTGFIPEKNLQEIEKFKFPEQGFHNVVSSNYMGVPGTYHQRVGQFKTRAEAEEFIREAKHPFLQIEDQALNLQICAPAKDMVLNWNEKIEGNEIVQIPDPIVLFPLPHACFMIVTAWGDESKDPDVLNERLQ